jgi:putative transposase
MKTKFDLSDSIKIWQQCLRSELLKADALGVDMWTQDQRSKHKVVRSRQQRSYPTDLKDEEWRLIEPLLLGLANTGPPRQTEFRSVINELRYLVRVGFKWRMLPNDFQPWETVYYW